MAKRKTGRPTKLTPSVIDTICEGIEVGANYADVAAAAGISSATLSAWRDAGQAIAERVQNSEEGIELSTTDERLLDFWKRFAESEAQGAINAATILYNAAMKDPDYALKWLERRRPDDWRPVQRNEITGADGGPVRITQIVEGLPDDAI